jgi:hypothetical protein
MIPRRVVNRDGRAGTAISLLGEVTAVRFDDDDDPTGLPYRWVYTAHLHDEPPGQEPTT